MVPRNIYSNTRYRVPGIRLRSCVVGREKRQPDGDIPRKALRLLYTWYPGLLKKTEPRQKKAVLRPMPTESRSQKVFFQKYCFQRTAENILVSPLWEKREHMSDFAFFFCSKGCRRRNLFFSLHIVNTLIKLSSCYDRRSISR